MNYSNYFQTKRCATGENYICKTDDCPSELADLIRSIHIHVGYDCLPNDWLYETTREAFRAMEDGFDIENDYPESDIYHSDLINWMINPYADAYVEQAHSDGLLGGVTDIYLQVGCAQIECKTAIYQIVNDFIVEQKAKEQPKRYRLNGLDDNWIYEAESEEDATAELLRDLNYSSLEKYEAYCVSIGINPELNWKLV